MKFHGERYARERRCRRIGASYGQHRQLGLTIIELVIALAIIGLIAGVTVVAIDQLLRSTRQANDQQYAVSQLRQAEHYITRDALMTQTEPTSGDEPSFLILTWSNLEGTQWHRVEYALEPAGNPLMSMRRHMTVRNIDVETGDVVDVVSESSVIVAQRIHESSAWEWDEDEEDPILTVTLRTPLNATANSPLETRIFEVQPRTTNLSDLGELEEGE